MVPAGKSHKTRPTPCPNGSRNAERQVGGDARLPEVHSAPSHPWSWEYKSSGALHMERDFCPEQLDRLYPATDWLDLESQTVSEPPLTMGCFQSDPSWVPDKYQLIPIPPIADSWDYGCIHAKSAGGKVACVLQITDYTQIQAGPSMYILFVFWTHMLLIGVQRFLECSSKAHTLLWRFHP